MDGIDEFKTLELLSRKWDTVNMSMVVFDTAINTLNTEIAEFELLDGFDTLVEQSKKDKISEYKLKLEALNV